MTDTVLHPAPGGRWKSQETFSEFRSGEGVLPASRGQRPRMMRTALGTASRPAVPSAPSPGNRRGLQLRMPPDDAEDEGPRGKRAAGRQGPLPQPQVTASCLSGLKASCGSQCILNLPRAHAPRAACCKHHGFAWQSGGSVSLKCSPQMLAADNVATSHRNQAHFSCTPKHKDLIQLVLYVVIRIS